MRTAQNPSNHSARHKSIAKRPRLHGKLFVCCSMSHFCKESKLPFLYAVDCKAHVMLQAVSHSCHERLQSKATQNVNAIMLTCVTQVVSLCSRCFLELAQMGRGGQAGRGLVGWWAALGFLKRCWVFALFTFCTL